MGSGSDSRPEAANLQTLVGQAVQSMDDAFFLADHDGCFTYVNDALASQTAVPADSLCGKGFTELFAGDDLTAAVDAVERVLAGENLRAELELVSGSTCEVSAGPLRESCGTIVGFFGSIRDVTEAFRATEALRVEVAERRRAEEAYRRLVERSLQGVVVVQDGRLVFANPSIARMLGYTVRELLRGNLQTIRNAIHSEDREVVWNRFQQRIVGDDVPANYRFRIFRKDGSVCWVEVFASRIEHDGRPAIQAALVDVTEEKHHDREREAVVAMATSLRTAGNRAEMLPMILDNVSDLLDADGALIAMVDAYADDAVLELAIGVWSDATGDRLSIHHSITGLVIDSGEVYVNNDVSSDSRFARPEMIVDTDAVVGIPLIARDETIGVMWVGRSQDFVEEDVRLLTAIGEMTANAIQRTTLFEALQLSNLELAQAYDTTLEGWSRALELRDRETEGHAARVSELAVRLARELGFTGRDLVHVRRGALLHDIGKMGIPDSILFKPAKLTDEEWEVMHRHPTYARDLLGSISFLEPAMDIPYCHHERWDGSGYPRGLKGDEIPLTARAFAVIDVWDALCTDRPYRAAWPRERAVGFLRDESGRLFDPKAVSAFLSVLDGGHRN